EIEYAGTSYRLLDPIALLKTKAACVRDFDQKGPPERHDRAHLQLIARCWPYYLRSIHARALEHPEGQANASRIVSRAFDTLQNRQAAEILAREGINRVDLMPPEFAESSIDKIRAAYRWQLPRIQT
ncbi:MAG TPA: hypothetical protein VHV47_05710, partial [Opitutaceae bacterium]|nr:hypothetical protein [Opitutaceae bacterium]